MLDVQREVVAFLSTSAAYGLPSEMAIERLDTHISIVWLAGARAYKLKRAVQYDYVDFSTVELRHAACDAEIRLNRRTAPSLYLGVRAVTREADGTLALDGGGQPLDWVVEMKRFDQDALFDGLAERNLLELALMDGVADAIARLHAVAEQRSDHGGRQGMAWVVHGNAHAFEEDVGIGSDREIGAAITAAALAAVEDHAGLLEERRLGGSVRVCHGDLHLRNIFLLDGVPTLFDAVEFNDEIACIDVLYDLGFLLMDLWHRGLKSHANAVFNCYLAQTVDLGGILLLPLFLSCRAAVRAKTSATAARMQPQELRTRDMQAATREYLSLAETLLRPAAPCLLAIGGFSGSGKSTLARQVAHRVGAAPGALILRSDVIRKQQLGVAPLEHLGAEAYTTDVSRHVYQTIAERARATLMAGHGVIADAVYARREERLLIAAVAHETGVPFVGLWLEAPPSLLAKRLSERAADVSDATPGVLDLQLHAGEGLLDWQRLDASLDMKTLENIAEGLVRAAMNTRN